jgi:hypothetical protein
MLDESVVVVGAPAALSVCWLCVGVGAAAPVPSCEDEESVVVVVDDEGVVVMLVDGVVDIEESVVVEDGGVVVEGVVDIEESVVVVEGDVVTSPVDVACEPSFETRMWLLVWPSTTAGERAIAAIAMSLIFMSSP